MPGSGMWSIVGTVRLTCPFSWVGDIQILGHSAGALLIEGGVLTTTGWINITQGGVLDLAPTGTSQLHVEPGNPAARLRVANGASFHADSAIVELEGLDAPGSSNQGSISLINVSLTARGTFSATTNSLLIARSVVDVTVPPADPEQPGGDGVLNLGGRIVGSVTESTITLRAADGGVGTQGASGGPGGSATSVVQARSLNYVTLRVQAGSGGSGGSGPPGGVPGGDGGLGGAASLAMSADSISNSVVEVIAGPGGVGGNGGSGGEGIEVSGGNGGAGRVGGDATFALNGYNDLVVVGSSVRVVAGAGGSGGAGGWYYGNLAQEKGGDAGHGAQGGQGTAVISAPSDVTISQSVFAVLGGPGGLGNAYGRSVVPSSLSSGRAGNGGNGGLGVFHTNADASTLVVVDSEVKATGGAGGSGGEGDSEGGDGGDGANSLAAAHARHSIQLERSCYRANGGPGGPAAVGGLASGHGGSGGKGNVTLISEGEFLMFGGCLNARSGRGGPAETPERVGADGLEADLWVDADRMVITDATIQNPLNDYNGSQPGHLYNVTFDLENKGQSPVIPRGSAPVWSYWNLTVLVTDGQDPIQVVSVSVETSLKTCPTIPSQVFYDFKRTGVDGTVVFTLVSHRYTSQINETSFVGCYDVESSYEGQSDEPQYVALEQNHEVLFLYPTNNYPPDIVFIHPTESIYRIDADHPDVPLEIIVSDPDDPITGVESTFTVWACIAWEPTCFDRHELNDTTTDPNTREVRYYGSFNVTNVNEWPSGQYYVCAKASDGLQESAWNCRDVSIVQVIRPIPVPELSAGGVVTDHATKLISFNGRVNNMDMLQDFTPSIDIMIYRWDFDGDGRWDYYSSTSGQTTHLYPNAGERIIYRANFSVVDTLGRESANVSREVTIDPFIVTPPGFLWTYALVIVYSILGAVLLTGTAYTVQRRRHRIEEDETKRREAEILANIHECPRCGDLLPEKFAVCVSCATEDTIASVKKTVAELKHVGVIVLEEEDLIEKAAVAFEGRDFETANQFLEKVKQRVEVNKTRHANTTNLIRKGRLHIRMLQEQGKDVAALEPELYHAELALGRSDFDGADQMVEMIRTKLQAVVYEDKRREILERFTKLERRIKAAPPAGDEEAKVEFTEATKFLQRAKLALGKRRYVESVGYYTQAFTLVEGAPPEKILTEPTDEELDLFETRMKMVEEGVYMGPAEAAGERVEKVWRPGEKEFDVGSGDDFKPGEGAGTMEEDRAHGRSFGEAQDVPPAVKPEAHEPVPEPAAKEAPAEELPAPKTPAEPEMPGATETPEADDGAAQAPAAAALACSVCGTALKPAWKRCPKCATPVPKARGEAPAAPATEQAPQAPPAAGPAKGAPTQCPNCQKSVKANWKKCPYCATPLV